MPIVPPRLDDRSFEDLVQELLARIPAHTPEWTHARAGDPGRTLLELFAWLGDALLYRANLVPERQRLVFLRLLGIDMRAASPAKGLVGLRFETQSKDRQATEVLQPLAELKGPVPFETLSELTVVDLSAEIYGKRVMTEDERKALAEWLPGLAKAHGLGPGADPSYYVTTPVFADGADSRGFDLIHETVDQSLWIALLARDGGHVEALCKDLQEGSEGTQRVLSIGVVPALELPPLFDEIGERGRIPHAWEISGPSDEDGQPVYSTLTVVRDTSRGLTRQGVVQVVVSGVPIGAPTNDVRKNLAAGVGNAPPRLDDPDRQKRLVTWIRLRPTVRLQRLSLSWVGLHVVEVEQRKTMSMIGIGKSSGVADQQFRLPGGSVERSSLVIEVEEQGLGFQPWGLIDDLVFAGPDAPVFQLDEEAGVVRFGDGLRGRIPPAGGRVRAARVRFGGGAVGNLPPGALKELSRVTRVAGGQPQCKLVASQVLAMTGGSDAERLAEAERRIPATLRHAERAVTSDDYRSLAVETPGVVLGRVEVLAKLKPHQRREGVPGVVSVMALPFSARMRAPNPRPDRPTLEAVHAHLDVRRTLGVEMYVIGCEYVPLGIAAGIVVREGYGREAVSNAVREALHRFLWPLPPGGPFGEGWPLHRPVRDREIEVAIAQVPGIEGIAGVTLFAGQPMTRLPATPSRGAGVAGFMLAAVPVGTKGKIRWTALHGTIAGMPVEVVLRPWQLPELLGVVVDADGVVPTDLRGLRDPFGRGDSDDQGGGVAIPVVPEVC